MYFRSVRFFLSLTFHACQKWIPKSLRSGGNKKLRAMIRNRPPPPPLANGSTPPRFFVSRRLFAPGYFARRHTGNMRPVERAAGVGQADALCSFVTQHLCFRSCELWQIQHGRFCLVFYPTSVPNGLSASRVYFGYLTFSLNSFFIGDLLRSR